MEWSRIITHGVRQLFLVINHVRFWKKQNALLLCQSWIFFKNSVYHICNAFLRNLSTHTKKMNYQLNVVLKKQSSCWRWKEQNHFRLSQSYLRRLSGSTLHEKTKKFRNFYILSRLGRSLKWNWLKQFSCRFASSLSKLRILERQIRGSQRNCFFLLLIGNCKFFFCVDEVFRFSFSSVT